MNQPRVSKTGCILPIAANTASLSSKRTCRTYVRHDTNQLSRGQEQGNRIRFPLVARARDSDAG